MTLCPNCGTAIAEEDLDCGCWTCGFTVTDLLLSKVNSQKSDEEKNNAVSRLSSSVFQTGEKDAQ